MSNEGNNRRPWSNGNRLIRRGQQFICMQPHLLEPGDLDCTDMDDDEFERAVMEAQLNTPKIVDATQ
jgi:hypothetical protein